MKEEEEEEKEEEVEEEEEVLDRSCTTGVLMNLRHGLCVLAPRPTWCSLEETTVPYVCGILEPALEGQF